MNEIENQIESLYQKGSDVICIDEKMGLEINLGFSILSESEVRLMSCF